MNIRMAKSIVSLGFILIASVAFSGCVSTRSAQETTLVKSGYAPVNGLEMYYEIHGRGRPLVLLHGAFSDIGTSFGALLPSLAKDRQVIAFELQGHGHTADIDRPMSLEAMADDTAAALAYLGIGNADIFGYSMGAGVALQVAIRHPEVVRKLVLASVSYDKTGLHPGLMDGFADMRPEMMYGSPWHEEYLKIAPRPGDFDRLFAKKTEMDKNLRDISAQTIVAIAAPVLLIVGDSDIIRSEHAVEMFRLLGGGVAGDLVGLPASQLAILPGTTHVTVVNRVELLLAIVPPFLDAPMPKLK